MRSIPGLGLICRRGRFGFIFFFLVEPEKVVPFSFFSPPADNGAILYERIHGMDIR